MRCEMSEGGRVSAEKIEREQHAGNVSDIVVLFFCVCITFGFEMQNFWFRKVITSCFLGHHAFLDVADQGFAGE